MYYSAEDKARVISLVAKTHGARQRRFEQDNGPSPSQRSPNSIEALVALAESASKCRHVSICHYFGEPVTPNDAPELCGGYCDVCKNPAKVRKHRDEGLIELDFPATQAVLQARGRAGDEDEDPFVDERGEDDYEPDRTQVQRRGGRLGGIEEEGSEEEDEDDEMPTPVQPNPRREGFRTAAVQRDRDRTKAMQTLEEEPESSPLPELGPVDLAPTQVDSSDPADEVEVVDRAARLAVDLKGSMVETPLDSEAELPPSAQSSKHIEPPAPVSDDEVVEVEEVAVADEVEAAAGAEVDAQAEAEVEAEEVAELMELDPEDALERKGPELADSADGLEGAGKVEPAEAIELSSDEEEPVAKRPKRLSHAPLFAPSSQADTDDDAGLPERLEIPPAGASKPPPRDARKEVSLPFKQMTTAHKAGAIKGRE